MSIRVPLDNPRITQGFGVNAAYYKQFGQNGHNGIDYGAPTGTPIFAAQSGTVHFEGWGSNNAWLGGVAGIAVLIDHGAFYTGYAHLSSTIISKGQRVERGQLIGYVGATGTATGPHLHFEVLPKPVNINNGFYGRTNPNPYFTEERKVVNESDLTAIYRYGVLSRARSAKEGSDVYIGKTAEFVLKDHANSVEGRTKLASRAGRDKAINDLTVANTKLTQELLAKPTTVEVIKEIPVEVIKEVTVEKIVEVVKSDNDRSIGDLLSAVWAKLFRIK